MFWSRPYNIDHNVNIMNGANNFHGMGIISMTKPCFTLAVTDRGHFSETPLRRVLRVKSSELYKDIGIPILFYTMPENLQWPNCYSNQFFTSVLRYVLLSSTNLQTQKFKLYHT